MDDLLDPRNDAESMASHQSLTGVLGNAECMAASEPQALLDQVQKYIDSSDKLDGEAAKMEYWPLVKVVKVFLRNPILETGLVIVDLVSWKYCTFRLDSASDTIYSQASKIPMPRGLRWQQSTYRIARVSGLLHPSRELLTTKRHTTFSGRPSGAKCSLTGHMATCRSSAPR